MENLEVLREVLSAAGISLDDCYDEGVELQLSAVPVGEREVPKLVKTQAGYTKMPGKHTCGECWLFIKDEEEGRCAIVADTISENGSCNFWKKGRHMEAENAPENPTQFGQVEAGYMERKGGFSCSTCQRFDKAGTCAVVYGPVSPEGCCSLWTDGEAWTL